MAWRLSDFTEIGRLGAGATGRVVSARHDDTGTVVAIKVGAVVRDIIVGIGTQRLWRILGRGDFLHT